MVFNRNPDLKQSVDALKKQAGSIKESTGEFQQKAQQFREQCVQGGRGEDVRAAPAVCRVGKPGTYALRAHHTTILMQSPACSQ
eukprot:scaffold298259_cov42-Prasinocladus_malaysianus.AAC.1